MSEADAPADTRALHLDGDALAAVQGGAVDLADRGGCERLGLEALEDPLGDVTQLRRDDRSHFIVGERLHLVEEPEELVAVSRREEVQSHREHLSELDPGTAKARQSQAQADRSREAGVWPETQARATEVQREDAQDLPEAPRLAQEDHVMRIGAAGLDLVRGRDGRAQRSSSSRRMRRRGEREILILPFESGSHELREHPPRPAVHEVGRALRGQHRLAPVAAPTPGQVRGPEGGTELRDAADAFASGPGHPLIVRGSRQPGPATLALSGRPGLYLFVGGVESGELGRSRTLDEPRLVVVLRLIARTRLIARERSITRTSAPRP